LKLKLRRRLRAIRQAWRQGREAWREDIVPWWHASGKKPAGQQIRELHSAWRTYHRLPEQYFDYRAYCRNIDDPQAFIPCLSCSRPREH
jgi:hypothetical protein